MLEHLRDIIEFLIYDAMVNGTLSLEDAQQIEYELAGFEPEAGSMLLTAIARSKQQIQEVANGNREAL